jgi:hypothetical protein
MYVGMYAEVEFESLGGDDDDDWGHRLRIRELFGLSRLSLALSSNGSAIALQKRGAMMEGCKHTDMHYRKRIGMSGSGSTQN